MNFQFFEITTLYKPKYVCCIQFTNRNSSRCDLHKITLVLTQWANFSLFCHRDKHYRLSQQICIVCTETLPLANICLCNNKFFNQNNYLQISLRFWQISQILRKQMDLSINLRMRCGRKFENFAFFLQIRPENEEL